MHHIHASAVEAMFTGDVLPECGTYLVALCEVSIPALHVTVRSERVSTYALAGLEMDLSSQNTVSIMLFQYPNGRRGARVGVWIRGGVRTISRIPGILAVLWGCWFGDGVRTRELKGALEVVLRRWAACTGGGVGEVEVGAEER